MISLYRPYMADEMPLLSEILRSGRLAYGHYGREFEAALRDFVGCEEEILAVNSFSMAVAVVLRVLGVESGDEVIASPQSCLASTMPIVSYGAKVVWADIDPKRGTLSPDSVLSKITTKTKAILHNHHCGYVGYVDEINAIARERGIVVIDDCIEAFGAEYKGRKVGNLGSDVTIYSFQTVRLPNTVDGAAISFKDRKLTERAKIVRDLGVDRTTFRDSQGEISPLSDVMLRGYGATMSELQSYIGLTQLPHLSSLLERQRLNAQHWTTELTEKYPEHDLLDTTDTTPSYWVYGLRCPNKEGTMNHFRARGYSASSVHLPNTYYSVFGTPSEQLPGVQDFYSHFIALPSGWFLFND